MAQGKLTTQATTASTKGNPPQYNVVTYFPSSNRDKDESVNIGSAWINEKGFINIQFHSGFEIPIVDYKHQRISLFPTKITNGGGA